MRPSQRNRALAAILIVASSPAGAQGMGGMMAPANVPSIPPVAGFSEGAEIFFLHTEASDREIATLLTVMMGSPVLFVPALANAPAEIRLPVYVFTNGMVPEGARGPMGFQPDVFPSPPETEFYTPLREIVLAAWGNPEAARILRSAGEVTAAVENAELTLEPTGIVVNMPMVTWPDGQR